MKDDYGMQNLKKQLTGKFVRNKTIQTKPEIKKEATANNYMYDNNINIRKQNNSKLELDQVFDNKSSIDLVEETNLELAQDVTI